MIPCTIRQLEVFVAAAEAGHFGRTAGALGISQPAVTKQIATLERQIGMTLFVRRRGSTPVLSRDGAAFLNQARRLLAEVQSLNSHCTAVSAESTVVRIASGGHLLNDCIKPWLTEFARANDGVMISCNLVESSAEGIELLQAGEADLFVYTTPRLLAPGLHVEAVRPVGLSLYGGKRWEFMRDASPERLSELPFVLPASGSEGERLVLDALANAGVICSRIMLRQQYSDVAKQLVIDGLCLSVLFDTMAAKHVERGELMRFDLELPSLYRVICRRERPESPAVEAVTAALREALKR
jgi:DNA-binding transcriptional LysR family regulator